MSELDNLKTEQRKLLTLNDSIEITKRERKEPSCRKLDHLNIERRKQKEVVLKAVTAFIDTLPRNVV